MRFYGEDTVLWSSDYPHWDVEPPFSKHLEEQRQEMSESQYEEFTWRGALKFYRLDEAAILASNGKRRANVPAGAKPV